MNIVIEIGANTGQDTERLLRAWPDSILYAFEPTRELVRDHLWPKFGNNPRVRILPMAVDIENGFKTFNVASKGDWGTSSLHEFADDIQKKWLREDFVTTHRYAVPTITLGDFCMLHGIQKIDHLWIDAQGNDFNCLKSLGERIGTVQSGRCEVAMRTHLYRGTSNGLEDVMRWLKERGFETNHEPMEGNHEADLCFERKR